jgi:ribosomal protein S24E
MNVHDINEERARREAAKAERDEELDRISKIDNDIDRTEEIREFIRNHPGVKTPDVESVIKKLRAAQKEQAKKEARAKLKEQVGKPQADGRITVLHIVGRPDLNANACIAAMKQRDALVYRRGNKCVRIEGASTNDPSMSTIDSAEAMVETIAQHVDYRIEGDIVDPPANVAKTIIHRTRAALPTIQNIIRAPTLRPDCSILDQPGYDPATQMFYVPEAGFVMPEVPEHPTRDDALRARDTLMKPIARYPFTPLDRAAALSGMMIAGCRGALGNTPATFVDATAPGSGKGKFAQVMAAIALGRRAAAVPPGHDKKELAKRVVAHLLTGASFVFLDNLEQNFGGADLCSVLTESPVELRRLGASEQGKIDAKLVVIIAGNGPKAEGDMTRRTQSLCIDWQLPYPDKQEFPFDPGKLALEMRGELLAACFTIARAYVHAGMPNRLKRQGSFEQWSDLVRSALVWLGEEDPAKSIDAARDDDPEMQLLKQLACQWIKELVEPAGKPVWETQFRIHNNSNPDFYKGMPVGARSLQDIVSAMGFEDSRMAAIMREIAPGRTAKEVSTKALGHWMGRHGRTPFEVCKDAAGKPRFYRFASRLVHDNLHAWWLEECEVKDNGVRGDACAGGEAAR